MTKEIIHVVWETGFFYVYIILIYRLMGKREIGKLSIVDLIVSLMIAQMATVSIENLDNSIWLSIIPIALLTIFQLFFSYLQMKSNKFRILMEGNPSVIIKNGKLCIKEMKKIRYSVDDLLMQLREQQVKNIHQVEYAILETNGKVSVFKYAPLKLPTDLPLPLITDSQIQKNTLKHIGKTKTWLKNKLLKQKLIIKNIYYVYFEKGMIKTIKKR